MPNVVSLDMPAAYWRGKAQRAQRSGDLQEAVRLYRAALRKHDDNGIRRELAQAYAELGCMSASDRLYLENLARSAQDADSLYGLARNRSLAGDEYGMADLLDLYLRLAPCGDQADRARDILWQMPREAHAPRRMRRAQVLYEQAADRQNDPARCLELARRSWKKGKKAETAQLLCQLSLRREKHGKALHYALAACRKAPRAMGTRLLLAAALKACDMPHGCRAALCQAMELCAGLEQAPAFCHCALSLGQADLAVEMAERQLRQKPGSADVMLLLALALRAGGGQTERAERLLRTAASLEEENPVPRLLLDIPPDAEDEAAVQMRQSMQLLRRVSELAASEGAAEGLHAELVRMMRLPMPGMQELAVQLMIKCRDALGLRMALVENELPPLLCASALRALEALQSPLPCFVRVTGKLCLLPQAPRPPYDGDLHDLIRRLLHMYQGEEAPLERIVREVPPLWRQLPQSARRHSAQSRDDVWPVAFCAWVSLRSGAAKEARERLEKARAPRRASRAFMQLMRRSKSAYEMH